MERHLSDGAVPETELVVRLERDLDDLDDAAVRARADQVLGQPGLAAPHRRRAPRPERLLPHPGRPPRAGLPARHAPPGHHRHRRLHHRHRLAPQAGRRSASTTTPPASASSIEAEIAALHEELDQLDAGQRPQPDVTDCYDEARAIALQMERLITDIGQYGTMIEQATAALDEPIDSNIEYRDRQRQMYTDYQAAWDSQGRDSHRAFLRMINDPDQRAEFEADVAAVAEALPALDPALRKVMAGFFELVGHQIDEVERIQQRCAQRVKRFTAFGTMEQSRGVARQLNEAIGAARALLKSSFTDSRLDIDVPLARHAISSVGALSFRIGDLSNPKPAKPGDTEVDLTSFAALTTQVDAPAMSDMLNHAITTGPVSLPDAVAMLDTAYLGHVIVLWSWALKQPDTSRSAPSRPPSASARWTAATAKSPSPV